MKVENNNPNQINHLRRNQVDQVENVERSPDRAKETDRLKGKDRLALSERARLVAVARSQMENTPDVRSDKVNELKSNIDTDAYQVPYEKLANILQNRLSTPL